MLLKKQPCPLIYQTIFTVNYRFFGWGRGYRVLNQNHFLNFVLSSRLSTRLKTPRKRAFQHQDQTQNLFAWTVEIENVSFLRYFEFSRAGKLQRSRGTRFRTGGLSRIALSCVVKNVYPLPKTQEWSKEWTDEVVLSLLNHFLTNWIPAIRVEIKLRYPIWSKKILDEANPSNAINPKVCFDFPNPENKYPFDDFVRTIQSVFRFAFHSIRQTRKRYRCNRCFLFSLANLLILISNQR